MEKPKTEKQRETERREALSLFTSGKELFDQGQHLQAFAIWSKGYRNSTSAFLESKELQALLRKLRRDCQKKKLATKALETAAKEILGASAKNEDAPNSPLPANSNNKPPALYTYFSLLFFAEGLSLDCLIPYSSLREQEGKWKLEYETLSEPIYAKYRLALIDCLNGKLTEALAGVQFCQDRIPEKKHRSLGLRAVLEGIQQAQTAIQAAHQGKLVLATPSAWEAAGFSTPFESRPWKRAGIPPETAREFRDLGFTAKAALPWTIIAVPAAEAKIWLAAEMKNVEEVKRFRRAKISPALATEWRAAFSADSERAILFYKAGFQNPEEAAQWARYFQFPSDAMNWKEQGFNAEEARFWYFDAEVKDPYSAKREKAASGKHEDMPVSEIDSE